jgi:hypothetical protein
LNLGSMMLRIENLITLGSWSNCQPPPDYQFLANWGKAEFVRYTNDNQERAIIVTVAGQAEYPMCGQDPFDPLDFRKWFAWNDDALWNILPGTPGNGSYLPQSTRNKIRNADSQYLDTPASIPYCWYKAQDQVVGLYPVPADPGVYVQLSGNRDLPPLESYEDELPWHERYVEACCLFGAYFYGKSYARGEELQTLTRYSTEAGLLVAEFNQDNNDKEACLVNRYVQAPIQEYMDAGSRVTWPYLTPSSGPWPGQN